MKAQDVTVEMGVEAFASTGLKPKAGIVLDGRYGCGCLGGAFLPQQPPNDPPRLLGIADDWIGNDEALRILFPEDYQDEPASIGRESDGWNLMGGFDMALAGMLLPANAPS